MLFLVNIHACTYTFYDLEPCTIIITACIIYSCLCCDKHVVFFYQKFCKQFCMQNICCSQIESYNVGKSSYIYIAIQTSLLINTHLCCESIGKKTVKKYHNNYCSIFIYLLFLDHLEESNPKVFLSAQNRKLN